MWIVKNSWKYNMVIKCEQLKGNKSRQMCGCWNGNWQMSRELQHIASQDCKYVKVGVKDAFLRDGEASDMKWNGRMASSSSGPPDNEPQQRTASSETADSHSSQNNSIIVSIPACLCLNTSEINLENKKSWTSCSCESSKTVEQLKQVWD